MTSSPLLFPCWASREKPGSFLSEYKKHLRDGEAHQLFKERVSEELGDLLWYIANVASKFALSLDEVASANLAKVKERWATEPERATLLRCDAFRKASDFHVNSRLIWLKSTAMIVKEFG